ncbi:glycoside hydrolase family 128 protein [Xylona heveae TC161]|uniref:Glycoside hydrolase family 128 protein n=1 Tax=Xylona heveae (strain CBS 132557 / TC161) TaxID=1328760 RepID=A0A165A8J1_XYLHT|nr:glycoside hydrolase family 128 protein [Xylona heveae TC161]KZF20096.1 glycoside hydrolase family 128 protein [Xylona heveae TC161]
MHLSQTALLLAATAAQTALCASTTKKRGLVYTPSEKHPQDDQIWDTSSSDLTWYYNYGDTPSPAYAKASKLQFVPMLWGAPTDTSDMTFHDSIVSQINSGAKFPYVLSYNEPDGQGNGGSNVPADLAAETWIRELEPLRKYNVSLGAPAVTGAPSGFTWLQNFFTACNGNCHADFIPVHWYGDYIGLASHIGQVQGTYHNMTIWVTEFADPDQNLNDSQSFFNQSTKYFDSIDYITHYSYFGAFRSDASNVGPYSAMLTQNGQLTDIGSWYLGHGSTGHRPKGAAASLSVSARWVFVILAAITWGLA